MKLIINDKATIVFYLLGVFVGLLLLYVSHFFYGYLRGMLILLGLSVLFSGRMISYANMRDIPLFNKNLTWPPDKKQKP